MTRGLTILAIVAAGLCLTMPPAQSAARKRRATAAKPKPASTAPKKAQPKPPASATAPEVNTAPSAVALPPDEQAYSGPPVVGKRAPDFTLTADDGKSYTLKNQLGQWVVLAFYPADFTGGCTAEVCAIRDEMKAGSFEPLNVRIFGISVQDVDSHQKFKAQNNLEFPLFADDQRAVSSAWEVLSGPGGVAKRYTFYIDPLGVLRKVDDKVQPFSAARDIVANLKELQAKEPKPSLAATASLNEKIRRLNARLAANREDAFVKDQLALAQYLKGRNVLLDPVLAPGIKYGAALQQFNRALTLNPDLVAAQEGVTVVKEKTGKSAAAN